MVFCVLGIVLPSLALLIGLPTALITWLMANRDLRAIVGGEIDANRQDMIRMGRALSVMASALAAVLLVLVVGSLLLSVTGNR